MVAKAHARYLRISPFKMRKVFPLIKGKDVRVAVDILDSLHKKSAAYLKKIVRSAVANAKNKGYDENTLFISRLIANGGPMLKRYRAASFGRATMIRKRTAHILVELDTTQKLVEGVGVK